MNFYIAWINTYSDLKDLAELSHELEIVSLGTERERAHN